MNKFLLAFLLAFEAIASAAVHDLTVCTIFQDEAPYLKEWIEFHKLQGATHFYLYNNNSQDEFRAVLKPYIEKEEVTLIEWPFTYDEGDHAAWLAIQTKAYLDCIARFGSETTWLAFIDTDEFLFCPNGSPLPHFLKSYASYGGLAVNWIKFGTSNIQDIPPKALLIELLTRCTPYTDSGNRWYKSIVQPDRVKDCKSPHYFLYKEPYYAVRSNRTKAPSQNYTDNILVDKIRINHYWTRTESYLREKKIPSRIKRRPQFTLEIQLQMAQKYNKRQDKAILQFVEKLKSTMDDE